MSVILTSAFEYQLPMRPRITFTSRDGTDLFLTFDAFDIDNADFRLAYCDAERAVSETGSHNIVIQDVNNVLEKDHIRFARCTMEFGKTVDTMQPFFIGYEDIFQTGRTQSGYQEYRINGPSSKIQAAQLMLLIRKATEKTRNPDYAIGNLIIDMFKKRKSRPLNRQDIEEITDWIVDLVSNGGQISDETNQIFLPVINEIFSTFWDFLERMSAISGAPWDLDYSIINNAWVETITMKYGTQAHSGIIIKSGDLKNRFDNAAKVAYFYGPLVIEDNATSDAGVATRLYTTTVIDKQVISSQMSNAGSVDLVSKAWAQQVIIENDQRRINGLSLIMSKVGDPSSPKDRVNGDVVMDFGDNTPRGRVLATFSIPLSDIKTVPDTIFIDLTDKVKVRFLEGENKIWIRIFQRSDKDGDPNLDTANTIKLHHNGVFNSTQSVFTATSTGPNAGDYKKKDTQTWASDNKGPIFCYEIFSNINRLIARSNPTMAKIIGWKEQYVDTSFLQDFPSVNRYLSLLLMKTSKPRRAISDLEVTIPDNYIYKPFNWVNLNDGLSNESQDFQIQRSRIQVSAIPDQIGSPIGALSQFITLQGSFNPLTASCSCE